MESSEVQIFYLNRIKPELGQKALVVSKVLVGLFVIVSIVIVCLGLPLYIIAFSMAILPLSLLVFWVIGFDKSNRVSQVLELYNDKIIIKEPGEVAINFKEIRFYQNITTKVNILKITLNDGNVVSILDGLNGGLKSFITAFEEKINKQVIENKLPITDNTSATDGKFFYVVIGIIICFILFFIASVFMH